MAKLKQLARSIFNHALEDCSIECAFDRTLRITTDVRGTCLNLGGHDTVSLNRLQRVRVISIGKAAAPMLQALLTRLPLNPACDLAGVLIAPERPDHLPATIQFFHGGHPLPNQASFDGALAALSALISVGPMQPEDTLCVYLISGGASAMMEFPLDNSISLEDTIAFHKALVHSGASIVEINCVRKHFSAVKGGRLAIFAGAAQQITLLVSDVPPAHLDALASGPTIADPTTITECRKILARYSLLDRFPNSVRRFFSSANLPETPKPRAIASQTWKLLDSDDLAEAARSHAANLGFHAVIDNTCDDWSYDAAADYLLDHLRQLRREHARVCLISAGEITVRVPTREVRSTDPTTALAQHVGGRNQHFALYLATQLWATDAPLAVLSAGSDGIDGNSKAAGAIVDEHTLNGDGYLRASRDGALRALEGFDSSTWLSRIGATIVTGPTGHNLRDLRILIADNNS